MRNSYPVHDDVFRYEILSRGGNAEDQPEPLQCSTGRSHESDPYDRALSVHELSGHDLSDRDRHRDRTQRGTCARYLRHSRTTMKEV